MSYTAGYSAGKGDAWRKARKKFGDMEQKSLIDVFATNTHFQAGAGDAQNLLTSKSKDILALSSDGDENHKSRDILIQQLLPAQSGTTDDEHRNTARHLVKNMKELTGLSYKVFQAAAFVSGLTEPTYRHMGFMGHLQSIKHIFNRLSKTEPAQALAKKTVRHLNDENNTELLACAIQEYAPEIVDHIQALIDEHKTDNEKEEQTENKTEHQNPPPKMEPVL